MITLILNSTEGPLQLLLAENNHPANGKLNLKCAQTWEPQGQGAETLIPNLAAMLEQNKLTAGDISRIACVRGPGSFTGIRLALTTALGLARSIPSQPLMVGPLMAGLDYLPLLAQTALETLSQPQLPCSIWVLTHARRGQIHLQGFEANTERKLNSLYPPQGCLTTAGLEIIKQHSPKSKPIFLTGSALPRNPELPELIATELGQQLPQISLLAENLFTPSQTSLMEAASLAQYSSKPIDALYLRSSDAEENLPYIAAGLGLDPHQAMLDLLKLTGRGACP